MRRKISVVGSCLSNLTAAGMDRQFGWERYHCIHHNRSDSLLKYHIDKTHEIVPLTRIRELFIDTDPPVQDAMSYMLNQLPEEIGFFEKEREIDGQRRDYWGETVNEPIDAIFFDNFMDLSAKLMVSPTLDGGRYKDSPMFINTQFYQNRDELNAMFEFTEYLAPAESARNWFRIYQHYRELRPDTPIYFFCFQYDTSVDSPERQERGKAFAGELIKIAEGSDLKIINPICAPDEYKIAGDWTHFTWDVYNHLAKIIHDDLMGEGETVQFPLTVTF